MSAENPEKFNKRLEGIEIPPSGKGLGLEQKRAATEATRTKNQEEIVQEIESTTLAPSMIDRCFQAIFGRLTEEYTKDIYDKYIGPLKSPTAKLVMKTILIHSSYHPEVLARLGLDGAKKELVNMVNSIAEKIDTENRKKKQGPETDERKVVQTIQLLKSAVEKIRPGETEAAPASPETPEKEEPSFAQKFEKLLDKDTETLAKLAKPSDRKLDALIKESPKGLTYFPGMPGFTHHLRERGYDNFSLVKVEAGHDRITPDEEVYDVYFGKLNRGRFVIRRKGNIVERNLMVTYPDTGKIATVGVGGSRFEDLLRQAKELIKIAKQKIKEKIEF